MESAFELVAVAFVRSTGGRVRVLLAIDRDGAPLFDGEPALLAEHRPGAAPEELELEGADAIGAASIAMVRDAVASELAALLEGAFTRTGEFDGQLLLGRSVTLRAPAHSFDG